MFWTKLLQISSNWEIFSFIFKYREKIFEIFLDGGERVGRGWGEGSEKLIGDNLPFLKSLQKEGKTLISFENFQKKKETRKQIYTDRNLKKSLIVQKIAKNSGKITLLNKNYYYDNWY